MDGILIPCPKCGQELRLRDRSLLGRMGRCPQCSHRFPLEEPEEVELELADAAPRSASAGAPPAGTSPRLVPDESPPSSPTARAGSRRGTAAKPANQGNGEGILPAAPPGPAGEAERLRAIRRRAARRRKLGAVIGGATALVVGGIYFAIQFFVGGSSAPVTDAKKPPQIDAAWRQSKDALRANVDIAEKRDPTRGDSIRLLYIPSGASLIFNLHPRAMWTESQPRTVLEGLGTEFDAWTKQAIRDICLFDREQIDEALICVHLLSKGTPPFYSTVVHFAEPPKRSELVLKFQAELTTQYGPEMYIGPERAYMLRDDDRTVCIAPADKAAEMADAVARPNPLSTSLEGLLPLTDRKRHFTFICLRQDLIVHREQLFPETLRPVVDRLLLWLGNDVDAFAWSLHQGGREFHSELLIRPATASSPARLHNELRRKLDRLPLDVLWAVERMEPERMGPRQLIGRYPAMVQAFALETLGGIGDKGENHVQFTTVLPERAGPNLSVATALTWDQSLRTDFTREVASAQPSGAKLPETIAGRLQLPIELQFERMPLQQAFEFIGGEIQVAFEIDGDALKAAGMTKNMEQNQSLGTAPAIQGIQAILDRYKKEGMCVVIDEGAKTATVTTTAAAEAKGQKPSLTGK